MGEWVKSMRLSNTDSFQPSPASNLPARRPQGCSCVVGVRAVAGDTLPALPNPSLPPLVTALRDCVALPCPQDGRVFGVSDPQG